MADRLPELTINLSDPEDVRARLPEAQRVAEALRRQAEELVERAEKWDRLVVALEAVAAEPSSADVGIDTDAWAGIGARIVTADEAAELSQPILEESEFNLSGGSCEDEGGQRWPAYDGLFVGS